MFLSSGAEEVSYFLFTCCTSILSGIKRKDKQEILPEMSACYIQMKAGTAGTPQGTTLTSKSEISGENLIYVAGKACSLVILLMAFKNSCDHGFEIHSFLLATITCPCFFQIVVSKKKKESGNSLT